MGAVGGAENEASMLNDLVGEAVVNDVRSEVTDPGVAKRCQSPRY